MKKIILASGSPRRREILTGAGLDFDVYISGADEGSISPDGITFGVYVQELALLKARDAAKTPKENTFTRGHYFRGVE
jgi:septum formation protein